MAIEHILFLIIRAVEKLLIVYFLFYFIIDFFLFFYSLFVFLKSRKNKKEYDYKGHPISIIVPAFNEEVSIVDCIRMLKKVDYDEFEIIVVNDGSSDKTLNKILEKFEFLKINKEVNNQINTGIINKIYKEKDGKTLLIDKQNGGKADAINAGINYSSCKYICTIDADSILDRDALKSVIQPMIENPNNFVTGGQLAISNDAEIKDNKVVSSKMPSNYVVLFQIIEYIKSFMISRIGLSKINSLLIMSGAFSLYKKEDLLNIGGFLTPINNHPYILKTVGNNKSTVCEDMEIVVRLWRYYRENKKKGKASFLPNPICWTEVPESTSNLYKQRVRWQIGLAESIRLHSKIIFEPRYGATGLIAMPYYFFFELLSPLIKIFTFNFLVLVSILGLINPGWVILLIISITLITAIIMSSATAIIESWSEKLTSSNREALRYKTFFDWTKLILAGIISDFTYAFFRVHAQFMGIINFFRNKREWNKFQRVGIQDKNQ